MLELILFWGIYQSSWASYQLANISSDKCICIEIFPLTIGVKVSDSLLLMSVSYNNRLALLLGSCYHATVCEISDDVQQVSGFLFRSEIIKALRTLSVARYFPPRH